MYIPAHFAADGDLDKIAAFVERVSSADLVTFDGTRPVATLLPVIWDRSAAGNGSGYGRLLGHIALQNPQWSTAQPGAKALAIVDGPQAYVSPSWYPSSKDHGRAVPTWNYTSVHFTGEVKFHKDPQWLREIVTSLTERYEGGRADRWWMTDAPETFVEGQLRAIVGMELVIEQLEAKEKLSQNRPPEDRVNVIAALRQEPDPQAHEIADLMTARET
jgi:transcriptional regulator